MARRQLTIQRNLGAKPAPSEGVPPSAIEALTSSMATVEVGFEPTDQRVYKISLDHLMPDPTQPRHVLPYDLRQALYSGEMSAPEIIQTLFTRAEQNDTMAVLILGGKLNDPLDPDEAVVEENSLLALARSIHEVGLRQPINVYQVNDVKRPGEIVYRVGEGERRFWAHHVLVQQGHEAFRWVRCIVEVLPADEDTVYRRQAAENAARVDLPAIARSRAMARLRERLEAQLGRESHEPIHQRDVQAEIGQQMKLFTGRAVGDRMVRNYLALLNLTPEAQDLAEAAQLTEKQLRPVMQLKTDFERLMMIKQIIAQKLSSRQISQEVASPIKTLREVTSVPVEERFENKVIGAAKTIATVLTLPHEAYEQVVLTLAKRARDPKTHEVLRVLQQTLGQVLQKAEELAETKVIKVGLGTLVPNVRELEVYLPTDLTESLAGVSCEVVWGHLQAWQRDDVMLASRLHPFFRQVEMQAEALRAGEVLAMPSVQVLDNLEQYQVITHLMTVWAHVFLAQEGLSQFSWIKVELRL